MGMELKDKIMMHYGSGKWNVRRASLNPSLHKSSHRKLDSLIITGKIFHFLLQIYIVKSLIHPIFILNKSEITNLRYFLITSHYF